jgi:type II secretory pathway pseudopilin PulG
MTAMYQRGFTYVIALFLVAALSVLVTRGLKSTLMDERRDKEAQLLEIGQVYRDAIRTYYDNSPGTGKTYPPTLEALLEDGRTTTLKRPLRRLYRDPITASEDWGIVPAPDGGVMGVYSLSEQKPIKNGNFPLALANFVGAKKYQNWQFIYLENQGSTPQ